jgi:hypothetical protein
MLCSPRLPGLLVAAAALLAAATSPASVSATAYYPGLMPQAPRGSYPPSGFAIGGHRAGAPPRYGSSPRAPQMNPPYPRGRTGYPPALDKDAKKAAEKHAKTIAKEISQAAGTAILTPWEKQRIIELGRLHRSGMITQAQRSELMVLQKKQEMGKKEKKEVKKQEKKQAKKDEKAMKNQMRDAVAAGRGGNPYGAPNAMGTDPYAMPPTIGDYNQSPTEYGAHGGLQGVQDAMFPSGPMDYDNGAMGQGYDDGGMGLDFDNQGF